MDLEFAEGTFIPANDYHFHRRLFERYDGMVLAPGEYSGIIRAIHTGDALLLRTDARGNLYAVKVQGRFVHVAFRPSQAKGKGRFAGKLATAYPRQRDKNRRENIRREQRRDRNQPSGVATG